MITRCSCRDLKVCWSHIYSVLEPWLFERRAPLSLLLLFVAQYKCLVIIIIKRRLKRGEASRLAPLHESRQSLREATKKSLNWLVVYLFMREDPLQIDHVGTVPTKNGLCLLTRACNTLVSKLKTSPLSQAITRDKLPVRLFLCRSMWSFICMRTCLSVGRSLTKTCLSSCSVLGRWM